jgi:DNA modification methylase
MTYRNDNATLLVGDCVTRLREIADGSVRCCVTSPPYWGLRDYGVARQIGQEATPDEYVSSIAAVASQISRVLSKDGTFWLNLGDGYYGGAPEHQPKDARGVQGRRARVSHTCERCGTPFVGRPERRFCTSKCASYSSGERRVGFDRPKSLLGIPWRIATRLVNDGWILRNAIIWHKPNHLPTTAEDRLACSYEHLFLFVQKGRWIGKILDTNYYLDKTRLPRGDVWSIPTEPGKTGHAAPFPPALVEPCILAGSQTDDVVLDPFTGSGTTGVVTREHGRRFLGVELNPDYAAMAWEQISNSVPSPQLTRAVNL